MPKKAIDPHDAHVARMKRTHAIAEEYADGLFRAASLSLDELEAFLMEHGHLERDLFDAMLEPQRPDETDDDYRGQELSAQGDAFYILGFAMGHRFGHRKAVR